MQTTSFCVLIITFLAIVLLPQESLCAIECYECINCEAIDGQFDKTTARVVRCNGSCHKTIQDKNGVSRGCFGYGDTEGCKRVSARETTTCTCNTNLCNLATAVTSQLTVTLLAVALSVIRILF